MATTSMINPDFVHGTGMKRWQRVITGDDSLRTFKKSASGRPNHKQSIRDRPPSASLVQERGVQLGMVFLEGTNVRTHQNAAGVAKRGDLGGARRS